MISAALLLNSLVRPAASMPKMGALAVSMRSWRARARWQYRLATNADILLGSRGAERRRGFCREASLLLGPCRTEREGTDSEEESRERWGEGPCLTRT